MKLEDNRMWKRAVSLYDVHVHARGHPEDSAGNVMQRGGPRRPETIQSSAQIPTAKDDVGLDAPHWIRRFTEEVCVRVWLELAWGLGARHRVGPRRLSECATQMVRNVFLCRGLSVATMLVLDGPCPSVSGVAFGAFVP